MTTENLTPVRLQVQSPYVRLAAAEVAAEQSPVAMAQRAGDALYAWTMEHTGDGIQASINYHLEYQTVARELDCGPVCGCNLCRDEFGVKGSAL
jgi:hypothetical protein